MKKIENISVVIIAKNAQNTIKEVLQSLENFSDVVIYENGSTDDTVKIIEEFYNVNLVKGNFIGFGKTKNKAAMYSKNDWVLSLDADEVVSEEMFKNIQALTLDKNRVYEIKRSNYYKTHKLKYCGWGEERIVRLYNKQTTAYNDSMVHEKIITENCNISVINGELKHYPYSSISQFVQKADQYSEIFANEKVGKKSSSPLKAFFNAMFSFIKTYIFKRGFLDGYVGLVISVSHAVTNFYKYIKLYEKNKELKQ